jgi:hypothetical protein
LQNHVPNLLIYLPNGACLLKFVVLGNILVKGVKQYGVGFPKQVSGLIKKQSGESQMLNSLPKLVASG